MSAARIPTPRITAAGIASATASTTRVAATGIASAGEASAMPPPGFRWPCCYTRRDRRTRWCRRACQRAGRLRAPLRLILLPWSTPSDRIMSALRPWSLLVISSEARNTASYSLVPPPCDDCPGSEPVCNWCGSGPAVSAVRPEFGTRTGEVLQQLNIEIEVDDECLVSGLIQQIIQEGIAGSALVFEQRRWLKLVSTREPRTGACRSPAVADGLRAAFHV